MMPSRIISYSFKIACLTSVLLLATTAKGQEVAEIPFFNLPEGTVGLGGGIRGGQGAYLATDSEDQRTKDLIPLYLYEGKLFFARGTAGGLHIMNRESFEFNIFAKYRFQKLDPDSNVFYTGLEERKQSIDAGFQFRLQQKWGGLNMHWVTDTLDRHNGQEVQVAYRYHFEAGPWSISPYASWTWQDENLTNYYFGVSEAEALPGRPAYAPGESQWLGFGLNTAWHATDRIVLFANVGFAGTESKVIDSPLVEEAAFSQLFLGGTYVFGNARKPDYIMDKERQGEWSWRVNYGYQADGNIVSEIDQGDFSKSTVADTNIAGLTLSKLLTAGNRVDLLGNLAVFRHLEEDEGNGNFFSYALYVVAKGKGYSPWSKEEVFRWGLGFGMSYAETVPIAEQRKQTGTGASGNTSHFLNYMEMSLDFPLRRISKANWLQSCYAGLIIVHRSGIFGTSDILGDVAGGADWFGAHLECTR
jgi:outer membrane scaffolding protein for murein synthesis (MipA/OmpV family)